jgi:cysteine sulfinate desulfinase/cysteine desulfurase-like protein
MGVDADHSLRLSVGWTTTDADIDRFTTAFPTVVQRFRNLRGG